MSPLAEQVLVQICSYNSNMQGEALAQDLVDWLAPTFTTSRFLAHRSPAPDIVAVGFQELLPLHLGFIGLSAGVINSRDKLIRTAIEAHHNCPYVLVVSVVNVGVAMLIYAKDAGEDQQEGGVARRITDVETQWVGCGPSFMGNKGAVGVRFRLLGLNNGPEELFTFVNVHLTAHAKNLDRRLQDYTHIVQTLLFKYVPRSLRKISPNAKTYSTIYDTTHLFFFGDLNFRLTPNKPSPTTEVPDPSVAAPLFPTLAEIQKSNGTLDGRRELVKHDQLRNAMREGRIGSGLREGKIERFPCTYKYVIGCVDEYNPKRTPSWTDRILYTTALDDPSTPHKSAIQNVLYTSILAFTKSDHKPITALLLLPPADQTSPLSRPMMPTPLVASPPHLHLRPQHYRRVLAQCLGKSLDRIVGAVWCLLWLLGAGNAALGLFNVSLGLLGFLYWRQM
ncbi:hypothetical protein BS47DRAFT_1286984 [Hydnum rufescens UP504]|uniref:Inositol polyphosphate-related phosphatase domain-containing protein n=1 Tax=Hydnum rufescens UP504 TaxID=1448309 RepID=A0A9P6E0H0_9AGAM|nr:hypothetical protein BS47DRAFT_1286984 [Hydnum rufescens UP504]